MARKKFTYTTSGETGYVALDGDQITVMIPRNGAHPQIVDTLPLDHVATMIDAFENNQIGASGSITGENHDWVWRLDSNLVRVFTCLNDASYVPIHSQLRLSLIDRLTRAVKHDRKLPVITPRPVQTATHNRNDFRTEVTRRIDEHERLAKFAAARNDAGHVKVQSAMALGNREALAIFDDIYGEKNETKQA